MSSLTRQAATNNRISFTLQKTDQRILRLVAQLHYVTIDQLCDGLMYSRSSRSWLRKKVRSLWQAGYLQRQVLPREANAGSSPYAYRLDRKGFRVMKAHQEQLGLLLSKRYRRPDSPASQSWLEHDLAVNWILISAMQLDHESEDFALIHLYHDRSLKGWIRTQLTDGKEVALDPDGYLEFIYQHRWQISLLIECDRGHHNQRSWRKKVAKHVAYIRSGAHRDLFSAPRLQIPVFVESTKPLRAEQLKQWTEVELELLDAKECTGYFYFVPLHPETESPGQLFEAPIWSMPFHDEPVALVAAPASTAPVLAGLQVMQTAP